MNPLMIRIAQEIADKVGREINKVTIFRRPPLQAMQTIKKAKDCLLLWYNEYVKVRQRIEDSGSMRWEFNRYVTWTLCTS